MMRMQKATAMSNREIDKRSTAAPLSGADAMFTQFHGPFTAMTQSMQAAGEMRAALLDRWVEWEREQAGVATDAVADLAQCAQDCASAPDLDTLRKRQVAYATTVVELATKRHRALLQLATDMTQAVMDASLGANARKR